MDYHRVFIIHMLIILIQNININFGLRVPVNDCNTMWYSMMKESPLKIIPSGNIVLSDKRIILSCFVDDVHENNVTWFYNDKYINNNLCGILKCRIKIDGSIEILKPNNYQNITMEKNKNKHEYFCSRESTIGVLRSPSVFLKIADISDRINVSPNETTVYNNDLVKFDCHVDSYPAANITWWHNDKLIEIKESSKKYIMGQSGELYITSISQEDAGFYKCKASNIFIHQDIKVSNSAQLKIQSSVSSTEIMKYITHKIFYTEKKNIYKVSLGERLKLICGISGYYSSYINWVFINSSGLQVLKNSSTISVLELKNINYFHTGNYYCIEINPKNKTDIYIRDYIQIIVGSPPSLYNKQQNIILKEENNLIFKCKFDGEPEPSIYWLKNSKKIIQNNKRYIFKENSSVFEIHDINSDDTGEYQCVGKNKYGEYYASGEFEFDNMQSTKYIPKLAKCNTTSSNTINVSWTASDIIEKNHKNNYTVEYWITDDLNDQKNINEQFQTTQNTFVNINDLTMYTNYSFLVRSWGHHRCSGSSNIITCKTLNYSNENIEEQLNNENKTNIRLEINQPTEQNNTTINDKSVNDDTSDYSTGILLGICLSIIPIVITILYICYLKRRLLINNENSNETEMANFSQNSASNSCRNSLEIITEPLSII